MHADRMILVTLEEAAVMANVSPATIRRAINRGDLVPVEGDHRGTRLRRSDVATWERPTRGRPSGAVTKMPRGLLSVAAVAALRECSTWAVWRAIRQGTLATTQVGARYGVTRAAAMAWERARAATKHPHSITVHLTDEERRALERHRGAEDSVGGTARRLLESALLGTSARRRNGR